MTGLAPGMTLYNMNCLACQSASASGHYLPDLKTSPTILSPAAFRSVVIDGARTAKGMISFSNFMTAEQAESVRAYILSEARKTQAEAASKPATGSRGLTRTAWSLGIGLFARSARGM